METPRIGMAYQFTPASLCCEYETPQSKDRRKPPTVTGLVVAVNAAHRYFVAEYKINGYTMRESIKF